MPIQGTSFPLCEKVVENTDLAPLQDSGNCDGDLKVAEEKIASPRTPREEQNTIEGALTPMAMNSAEQEDYMEDNMSSPRTPREERETNGGDWTATEVTLSVPGEEEQQETTEGYYLSTGAKCAVEKVQGQQTRNQEGEMSPVLVTMVVEVEDQKANQDEVASPPEEPPYPILLTLQVIFMSYVLVQFHFNWGSNGNDGLPGVFDKKCSGLKQRMRLLLFWYLPLFLGAFLIPTVMYRIHWICGAACYGIWILALFGVTARAELWPEYWNENKMGDYRVYPSGILKPRDYNIKLYHPSTEFRLRTMTGKINWANISYVILQTITHMQELMLVLFLYDTAMKRQYPEEVTAANTTPWRPTDSKKILGFLQFIFSPSFQLGDIQLAFNLSDDQSESYVDDYLPYLYRVQGWGALAFTIVWAFIFVHYACNSDEVLVKSAKGEPGGLKGFRVFKKALEVFGTILFLPLMRTLTQTPLVCIDIPIGGGDYFPGDGGKCWEGEHSALATISMVMLISYFPISAGLCVINSCCEGAFEADEQDVKVSPVLQVSKKIAFAFIFQLHILVLKVKEDWFNCFFCAFYIAVNLWFCWAWACLKSRCEFCEADEGCSRKELKLGEKGVYASCSVWGISMMHFIWYCIKVYAGIVVFIVSLVPYKDMPFDNVYFLVPCVVMLVIAMPLKYYIGKTFGLHETKHITKAERITIKRSDTSSTLKAQMARQSTAEMGKQSTLEFRV